MIKEKIKRIVVSLNLINILSLPLLLMRVFPIKHNRVLLQNFSGKGYGDSPKTIAQYMIDNDLRYELNWAVSKKNASGFPKEIRQIKIYSLKYFYILATSKIWISNSRFEQFVKKRKKQYYIQTWHSPLRLKKIEYDAYDFLSPYYKKVMKNDSKMIDTMISGCLFSEELYRKSFGYAGEVKGIGTPRCDLFFDENKVLRARQKVCDVFNIPKDSKIVLYAPTFRKNTNSNWLNIDSLYTEINKTFNDFYLIVRLHPRLKNNLCIRNQKIIDASRYPDIQELICANDLLITDYSSCMFDQFIAKKPCILYMPDLKEYLQRERSLYFEINELPFPSCEDISGLSRSLEELKSKSTEFAIREFGKKVGLYENGRATELLVEIINRVAKNEKI